MNVRTSITAQEIAEFLSAEFYGANYTVVGVSALSNPLPKTLTFAKNLDAKSVEKLDSVEGLIVIAPTRFDGPPTQILSRNPRRDFAKATAEFFAPRPSREIHTTAVVDATAMLGSGVTVGPFSVIGPGVVVGDESDIRAHVVIQNASIGKRCVVKSHSIIGEEGFGVDFEDDGTPVRIPHLGRVVIGDDVEIGSLNTVARGTLSDTEIGDGAKFDDHIHVAHNVKIGSHTIVTAGAEISGSVSIGRRVWIGPQAGITNKVSIGDDALVGIGAIVTKPVAANSVVVGNPAKHLRARYPNRE